MAITKITTEVIADGAITSAKLGSGSVSASSLTGITTDNVSEGSTNVYHTAARARGSVSVTGGGISYDSGTGVIQIASIPNASLANSSLTVNSNSVSLGGTVTLDTDDIGEGSTNLYFTNARAQAAISGGTGVTVSGGTISIGQDVATSSTPTFGNITTTGYIAGPATFTIDPAAVGDNTGTVVIAGNLQVDGTTTTINSTTLTVDDKLITLASGSANAAAANGAGITVDGASATITYNGTTDSWEFNKEIVLPNNIGLFFDNAAATSTLGIKANTSDEITFRTGGNWDRLVIDGSGNATFAGTISSGGLSIAASSPNLSVQGNSATDASLTLTSAGITAWALRTESTDSALYFTQDGTTRVKLSSGGDISFYEDTGASAKLFWDSSSESLSIGTTGSTTDRRFQVSATGPSTATTQFGIVVNPTYPTNVTNNVYNLYTGPNLATGTTLTNLYNLYLEGNGYPSSTVTNSYGLYQAGANDKNYFAGNVGIGTNNPNATLHVKSTGNGEIEVERASGALINLQAQSALGVIGTDSNHDLAFKTNTAVGMRLTTSGRLGIGTASPAGNLHIKSIGDVGDAILIIEADNDNNVETDNPRIELRQDGNLVAGYIYTEGDAGVTATNTLANSMVLDGKGTGISFATGGLAPAQTGGPTNSTVRMTVASNGRVGIGTTSPDANLHVEKLQNTTWANLSEAASLAAVKIGNYRADTDSNLFIGCVSGGRTGLQGSNDAGTSAYDISLNPFGGNVGINDTVPDRKVSIIGDSTSDGQYPLSLDATNTDYTLEFRRNGTSEWWIAQSAGSFRIHENTVGDHFTILAGGNVGIGTTPSVALDILKSSARVRIQDGTNALTMGLWDGTNHRIEGDANRKILITSYHSDGIHLGGSGASNLVIKGGNVGIGNTGPTSKLHLGTNTTSGGIGLGIQNNSRYYTLNTDGGDFIVKDESAGAWRFRVQSNGTVVHANSGSIERIRNNWSQGLGSYSAGQVTQMTQDTSYTHAAYGMYELGTVTTRGFGQYVDFKTNLTSDNIMFMFYFTGYLYNRGTSAFYGGGYTYNSGGPIVISKDTGTGSVVVGPMYVYDLYRSSAGNLCVKIYGATTSYDEGRVNVFFMPHGSGFDTMRIIDAHVTNSTTNYY